MWISGIVSALAVVLLGLLLVWFLFPHKADLTITPIPNQPPSTIETQPLEGDEDPVTRPGKRRTTPSGALAGIRPRNTRGVVPRKPGDEIALPRMVKFMGSTATGRRICIIADCSGSMQMNGRMEQLKEELEKTLRGLAIDQQFYVIFFDHKPDPMPEKSWLSGGKDIDKVLPWIQGQRPRGGTLPMGAFEIAFQLNPRPDLIFFMTDGIIPRDVPERVAKLNDSSPKTPINTILFGGELLSPFARARLKGNRTMQGEDLLKQLAADSGGNYRFVADKGTK